MPGDEQPSIEDSDGRERSRKIRQIVIVLGAVAAIFVLLFLWRSWLDAAPPPAAPPPTTVVATVVSPTSVPAALEAVGSLRGVREVMLAPEVAGRITGISFTPGQSVGAGTTLVRLNDGPERADRAAAAAKAEFSRLQLARSRELVPTGAESREMLQQRQAEYGQAVAAVQQLDARLAQKRIAAPFAGVIGLRRVNLGQYVNPGDTIASLTSLDQLYVDFTVPQQELSKLTLGSEVAVTSDAWPGRRFTARVTTIEPRVAEDSRNIWVQGVLANPDRARAGGAGDLHRHLGAGRQRGRDPRPERAQGRQGRDGFGDDRPPFRRFGGRRQGAQARRRRRHRRPAARPAGRRAAGIEAGSGRR
jgi:multidrug efflux system membrane fusion protein